jgi:putative cell wall-binding protein
MRSPLGILPRTLSVSDDEKGDGLQGSRADARRRRLLTPWAALALAGGLAAPVVLPTGAPVAAAAAPTSPPVEVCGNAALLTGPAAPPAGAVTVPAGDDSALTLGTPGTTYWFAPGDHTLGTGEYTQIIPGDGDTYLGGPGAVVDGQGRNDFAFTQHASGVTVEYLTIEHFLSPEDQGVVNHTAATGWTVTHDTVATNPTGAGVEIGSHDVVADDCLTHNGEYGFNAYSTTGTVEDVTLTHDEISFNDAAGKYDHGPGSVQCGCSGGGKFWDTLDATVTTNYVHTNGDVGIWVDTDNRGFDISGNYIAHNYAEGVMYEISYNALISDNAFVDNAWGEGPGLAFPDSAVYISESGGDARVASNYSGELSVTGNDFVDNWGGVVLWENSNRYCGDGSDGMCTLVTPSTYTIASCQAHLPTSTASGTPDYYDNCRWKTQNVTVSDNTFDFTPQAIGPACTPTNNCGFNGLFSEYGTTPPWTAWAVPLHISDDQNDHFSDNTYSGPWRFDGFALGDAVTWTQWSGGFVDQNGSNDAFYPQDAGSTDNGAGPTTRTVTRIEGSTADATAAAELEHQFPATKGQCPGTASSRPVVLATDANYPDALASAYLARDLGTGTLLTPGGALSAPTETAIRREGITRVVVVGGPLSVSTAVVDQLKAMTPYSCGGSTRQAGAVQVTRVYGQTAYDTAAQVAEFPQAGGVGTLALAGAYGGVNSSGGGGAYNTTAGTASPAPAATTALPTAVVATGEGFQDAEAASTLAYADHLPILLTTPATLSTQAASAIRDLGIRQVIVMGGELAVSDSVVSSLEGLGTSVLRVAGGDYTGTAVELAELETTSQTGGQGLGWKGTGSVTVARGDFYSDGLAGAVVAADGPASGAPEPLLLTLDPSTVGTSLTDFLRAAGRTGIGGSVVTGLTVLGGTLAVTEAAVVAMETALRS